MKRTVYTSFLVLLLASSCSSNGDRKIISVEKKVVYKEPVAVAANREMTVGISGMSCEQACGGTIRVALKNTNAIDRCSFEFIQDRPVNTATITFDKDKISADGILTLIEKLNEGQFKTSNPTTKTIEVPEPVQTGVTPVKSGDEASGLNVNSSSIEFPNLFELFSNIIS